MFGILSCILFFSLSMDWGNDDEKSKVLYLGYIASKLQSQDLCCDRIVFRSGQGNSSVTGYSSQVLFSIYIG